MSEKRQRKTKTAKGVARLSQARKEVNCSLRVIYSRSNCLVTSALIMSGGLATSGCSNLKPNSIASFIVSSKGLEPSHLAIQVPKTCVSTIPPRGLGFVGAKGLEPPKPKGTRFTVWPNSPSLADSHKQST